MRCVQFTGQRAISQKQNDVCNKMLYQALEYVENCQSRALFVAFSCLDGQVAYSFWLCIPTKCLYCALSFVAIVSCD